MPNFEHLPLEEVKKIIEQQVPTATENVTIEKPEQKAEPYLSRPHLITTVSVGPNPATLDDPVLRSWKKISEYCGRGIRTLQRWECLFGFPVHRPNERKRGQVLAFRPEIDDWYTGCPVGKDPVEISVELALKKIQANQKKAFDESKRLMAQSKLLQSRIESAMQKAKTYHETTRVEKK